MIQIQSIERKPTIGIITALPKEYAAVKQLLDNPQEINVEGQGAGRRYLHGEVIGRNEGKHAVVLCLAVQMGNNSAAICASQLLQHFPEIKSIIMVGIAGGIPYSEKADDHGRLGDIVISNEKGVIQYDFDKETITENTDRHPPRPPSPSLLEGDNWQAYAAAVAASYTRALLESMPAPKSYIDSQPSRTKAEEQNPDVVQEMKFPQISQPLVPKMNILHLSDLHFGTLDQAQQWSNQLAEDLRNELDISCLDALILSGDIANFSIPDEYEAAKQFLDYFRQDFPLQPEQIIIVPGNHDLNWEKSKIAYTPVRRDEYDGRTININGKKIPDPNYAIDPDNKGNYVEKQDENKYKQRFADFSNFYESIKGQPYPLDYEQQCIIDYFQNKNLLILSLNSAWQLDHHYKSRASINMNAPSNALTEIRRNSDYNNCLKIAVWHHPLDSAGNDRITDQEFMEQLAVAGFRLFLHGHIHKAETSLYRYDMSKDGRKLDRICAGTFGAPTRELVSGYPWQYNILQFKDNLLTVYTRKRESENGAWEGDYRWKHGKSKSLDYYQITLKRKEANRSLGPLTAH